MVVTLVRHGPLTTRQLGETITERYLDWWTTAYGPGWPDSYYGLKPDGKRGTVEGPAPVTYTDLYQRLNAMAGGVVVRGARGGPNNAYLWRAVTSEDLKGREVARREQLVVPADLRERAETYAKEIGCEAEFQLAPETPFDAVKSTGVLVLITPRGRVEIPGPPIQSWYDAAIEVGLL